MVKKKVTKKPATTPDVQDSTQQQMAERIQVLEAQMKDAQEVMDSFPDEESLDDGPSEVEKMVGAQGALLDKYGQEFVNIGQGMKDLREGLINLNKMLQSSGVGPVAVSRVDADQHFQTCLEIATQAVMKDHIPARLIANPGHMDTAIKQIMSVAQTLHDGLVEHFRIKE